jgi:4-aminobutyrate aminotransferase-like enzyme
VASASLRSATGTPEVGEAIVDQAARYSQRAYEQGVIVVPAGLDGELMSATPPLTIGDEEIDEALELLA